MRISKQELQELVNEELENLVSEQDFEREPLDFSMLAEEDDDFDREPLDFSTLAENLNYGHDISNDVENLLKEINLSS